MFEQRISFSHRDILDSQLANIQQNILCNDSYTCKRKGNKEQFKANLRIIDKLLREADSHLTESLSQNTLSAESTVLAKDRVSESIEILMLQAEIRIKLADSSELGWNFSVSGVRILPTCR